MKKKDFSLMTSEGDDKETEPAQVPPKKELDEEKKAKLNEAMQKAKAIAARLAAQKKGIHANSAINHCRICGG